MRLLVDFGLQRGAVSSAGSGTFVPLLLRKPERSSFFVLLLETALRCTRSLGTLGI